MIIFLIPYVSYCFKIPILYFDSAISIYIFAVSYVSYSNAVF